MAQKRPFLLKNMHSLSHIDLAGSFGALLVGWLVGSCGAPAVPRKTPIYFMLIVTHFVGNQQKRETLSLWAMLKRREKKMSCEDVPKKHQILSFMFFGHHFAMYFDVLY